MNRRTALACGLLLMTFAATACACLWDYDTLQMERMRFPGALEIITGKFVRHSRAYYEWRITDRKKKLEMRPDDPALLDDLAVAYAKLGRPEEGIALLEPTLATRPDRYETLSNLGTLLFFAGRLEESKQYIRRALEINPNAHFGREKYQLLLTEYVQQSEGDEFGVMSTEERWAHGKSVGFARYILEAKLGPPVASPPDYYSPSPQRDAELAAATKGVLGMLHFADHRSPILLEALGNLLLAGEIEQNSTQLGARAYLQAAQVTKDPVLAGQFRKLADEALASHVSFHESGRQIDRVARLEPTLKKEVAAADAWFAEIEAKEKAWIAAGRDVDREFAAVYYDSIEKTVAAAEKKLLSEPKELPPSLPVPQPPAWLMLVGAICVGTPLALIGLGIASIVCGTVVRGCGKSRYRG